MFRALAAALAVLVALVGSLLLAPPRDATACAPAPPRGEEVQIVEEEAIILWDPAARTETFIRRAQFRSTARAFGFLVPTPTTPQLGEVPNSVFYAMADRIRPEIRYEKTRKIRLGCVMVDAFLAGSADKLAPSNAGPETSAVRVIATAHVAGFDATTLEADDASALTAWLDKHGFATTPALTAWLARYVEQKWKLTAFVVATDERDAQRRYDLATGAVRMTFQADRPFYPYREPAAEAAPSAPTADRAPDRAPDRRSLRVHFLSTERYAATLAGAPWSASVLFAAPIGAPPAELAGLADRLPHATVFVDDSDPRRGVDEIYFAPSADRSELRQPPLVFESEDELYIPIELIVVALLLVGLVVRGVGRRRRRAAASPP